MLHVRVAVRVDVVCACVALCAQCDWQVLINGPADVPGLQQIPGLHQIRQCNVQCTDHNDESMVCIDWCTCLNMIWRRDSVGRIVLSMRTCKCNSTR